MASNGRTASSQCCRSVPGKNTMELPNWTRRMWKQSKLSGVLWYQVSMVSSHIIRWATKTVVISSKVATILHVLPNSVSPVVSSQWTIVSMLKNSRSPPRYAHSLWLITTSPPPPAPSRLPRNSSQIYDPRCDLTRYCVDWNRWRIDGSSIGLAGVKQNITGTWYSA